MRYLIMSVFRFIDAVLNLPFVILQIVTLGLIPQITEWNIRSCGLALDIAEKLIYRWDSRSN